MVCASNHFFRVRMATVEVCSAKGRGDDVWTPVLKFYIVEERIMPKLNPRNTQELVSSHYYLHSFWNKAKKGSVIRNWPVSKIRMVHAKYVGMLKSLWQKQHPGKVYVHESPLA